MFTSKMKEHSTTRSILFVICQHGSYRYFKPLWEKWNRDETEFKWHVLVETKTLNIPDLEKEKFNILNSAENLQKEPNLIISSTTGSRIEKFYFNKAKKKKIKIFQLIDSSYDFKKRIFITNGNENYPDKLIMIDKKSIIYAESFDKIKRNISINIGHPAWENISPLKKKRLTDILFVSQPVQNDYKKELGYTQLDVINQVSLLKKEKGISSLNISYHPREKENNSDLFDKVLNESKGLNNCGTIIGMFSSLMVNAYYSGRNVISFQPVQKKNMDFLSQRGLIKVVSSYKELKENLFNGCIVRPKNNPFNGSCKRLDKFIQEQIRVL